MDTPGITDWIGRTTSDEQVAEAWPLIGYRALMDETGTVLKGDQAAYLSHWFYFTPAVPQSSIDGDGHPQRGGFLPPVTLPRRMWASSEIEFHDSFRVGETLKKTSEIVDVSEKQGKSGKLVFVRVGNRYSVDERPVLQELQTLVYRDHPSPDEKPVPGKDAPDGAEWQRRIDPTPPLLFRYSAVTFNAHRIHYDQRHASDEGYPDVVVHGQLTASLMLREFMRATKQTRIKAFSFRAMKPIFANRPFFVEGRKGDDGYELWARDDDGNLAMTASATV